MSTPSNPIISLEQIYQAIKEPRPSGTRVLTDQLWPRGLSKETLENEHIIWYRGASPTKELRQDFHHNKITTEQFNKRYRTQLNGDKEQLTPLLEYAQKGPLILLTAMKEPEHTYLALLKEALIKAYKT